MIFKETIYFRRFLKEDLYDPQTSELIFPTNIRISKKSYEMIISKGISLTEDMMDLRKNKHRRLATVEERIRACELKLQRWKNERDKIIANQNQNLTK